MAHISMITLGVTDVARARGFYEALGWRASSASQDDVAFLEGSTIALGLYGYQALAEDAGISSDGSGFRRAALAMNVAGEYAVDEALTLAQQAGGTIVTHGRATDWGGYSGYFADPDDHLWEVAHNPFFPLGDDGRIALPE